jgi:hypothetical protein
VRVEDFEEFALGGHEATEHENPERWVNTMADIKPSYCTFARQPVHPRRLSQLWHEDRTMAAD